MRPLVITTLTAAVLLLAGCDLFGGESADVAAARREAEGKAVGSACRHAMRAIEDCYTLNPKTMKAAVFTGWREMDEYMRENKIDGVAPTIPRPVLAAKEGTDAKPEAGKEGHDKDKDKGKTKAGKSAKKDADSAKATETAAKTSEGAKAE